jgi:hypothetical protein
MHASHGDLMSEIKEKKDISEELMAKLKDAVETETQNYNLANGAQV